MICTFWCRVCVKKWWYTTFLHVVQRVEVSSPISRRSAWTESLLKTTLECLRSSSWTFSWWAKYKKEYGNSTRSSLQVQKGESHENWVKARELIPLICTGNPTIRFGQFGLHLNVDWYKNLIRPRWTDWTKYLMCQDIQGLRTHWKIQQKKSLSRDSPLSVNQNPYQMTGCRFDQHSTEKPGETREA